MQTITINVIDKVATAEGNPFIVCGNSDYTILFNFDKAWNGYNAKTARFSYEQDGEEIIAEVPFAGNSCKAPVIHNTKKVFVGVYAGDILSTTRCGIPCKASILDGEGIEHEDPPEDIYNQIVEICNEAVTAAGEAEAAAAGFEATTRETFANAIKGNLYGAAVRADDVSPVEHNLACKVRSKNLLDLSRLEYRDCSYNASINGVTSNTKDSYYCAIWATYMNDFLISNKGKTLTFSTTSPTASDKVTGIIIYGTRQNGETLQETNSGKGENSVSIKIADDFTTITAIELRVNRDANKTFTDSTSTFANLQLEIGETATEYTPYVDPSTATVTRCGKNILATNETTVAGNSQWASANIGKVKIVPGNYVASCYFKQVGTDKSQVQLSARSYKDYLEVLDSAFSNETTGKLVIPFTVSEEDEGFQIYLYSNATANVLSTECEFTNIMVEAGKTATNFEEYRGDTHTTNADGTVEGITSLSPTMTLLTDTEGTIINCEYNRDTNKALTSNMVTAEGTVVSPNADFAEVAEWADGNPDNEDRTGYFVCANVPVNGIIMRKATSIDDVKGVSIQAPAFAGNYTKDKLDSTGKLLPKYSYVAIIGFVPVRDNGTCTVGGRCMPDDNGCAIPSSNSMGYQVVNRIDENRVLIIIEPNGDMVQRVKTKINEINQELADINESLITNEGTGNLLVLTDSSNMLLQSLKVYGKTTQFTTTGKNLIPYPYTDTPTGDTNTKTTNGITFTDNGDGSVTAKGTATGYAFFNLSRNIRYGDSKLDASYKNYATDGTIVISKKLMYDHENSVLPLSIAIPTGTTINETLYPQVEYGTTPTDWEPYTGGMPSPNPDYPQDMVNICNDGQLNVDVNGKSLFNFVSFIGAGYTKTADGLTMVVKDGRAITTGTHTKSGWTTMLDVGGIPLTSNNSPILPAGKYRTNQSLMIRTQGKISGTTANKGGSFTMTEPFQIRGFYIAYQGENKPINETVPLMLVAGSALGSYEEYKPRQRLSVPNCTLAGMPVSDGGNYTDSSGQQWVCDEIDFARGVYIQRCAEIIYSNEEITEPYMSTTGELTEGAKVLYVLAEPVETPLDDETLAAFAALHTNKPNTTITNPAGAYMSAEYIADTKLYIDKKFTELQALVLEG